MNDHKFGGFIKELQQKGLYDDALIIFVSDHGEELYLHGYWEHGRSGYTGGLNVPLIV